MERDGHLGRNGDTAAGQRQDHRVLILICCERFSKPHLAGGSDEIPC
jgi:hypothetical protein